MEQISNGKMVAGALRTFDVLFLAVKDTMQAERAAVAAPCLRKHRTCKMEYAIGARGLP